jgi:hypothetical protein
VSTTVKDEICGWVQERMEDVEQDGQLGIIGLIHFDSQGREQPILTKKAGCDKWGDSNALGNAIYIFAARHARGLIGAQSFSLHATYGNAGAATRFLPFGLPGMLQFGHIPGGGLATESPNAIGAQSQGMRLTELVVQGMIGQINPTMHAQLALIDRVMRRLQEVDQENRELWLAAKELIMELNKQRHDVRMQELAAMRAAEFQRQIMALAPALINMMAGKDIFPLLAADTSLLDAIAAGATPDDMRMVTSWLQSRPNGDVIAATLNDRYANYQKRMSAEKQEEERLIKSVPGRSYEEGERDAAGEATKLLTRRPNGSNGEPEPKALTNGHTNGHTMSNAVASNAEGDELFDTVLATVGDNEIDMLANMIAAKKPDQPDLAARIKARYETVKGRKPKN